MIEVDKFHEVLKKYKDRRDRKYPPYIYITNDDGKKIKYGITQLKILSDLMLKGFKIYKSTNKEVASNFMSAFRRLKEHGHLVRLYKINSHTVVFYPHKAREVVQELYKMFPEDAKRPGHMRDFEVPIMRNLNKLATIQWWKHKKILGDLTDSERNSYTRDELVEREHNKRRKAGFEAKFNK